MPRFVDKDRKAQEIRRAALRVFRQRGYHRTRMADIAAEAGIGKGTIYEYFGDKADILRSLFEGYFAAFKSGALATMESVEGPAPQLLALVDFAFTHLAEWEDHCAVYVDYFSAARAGDEQRFSLGQFYEEFLSLLRALIREGQAVERFSGAIDPAATAELLVSVFDGIVLHGVFTDRQCSREALRDATVRLLVDGLMASSRDTTARET